MKKKFQHIFVCLLVVVIAISFYMQIQEEKAKKNTTGIITETGTDSVIKQVEISETEKKDIYQEEMVIKRDDFFLLQVKNQSEKVYIFDSDINQNKGKLSVEIESVEYDENGLCNMNVKVTSFLSNNMIFRYEDRLKMIYIDNNLQIPLNAAPEEVCVLGTINDESNINYVKLTMEGGYERTDEVRALCEIVPGENYFSICFNIGKTYKNNEEYGWCLSSLNVPGLSGSVSQYFNTDYVIKTDFDN